MLFRFSFSNNSFDLINFRKTATTYTSMMSKLSVSENKYVFAFDKDLLIMKILLTSSSSYHLHLYDYNGDDRKKIEDVIVTILGGTEFYSSDPKEIIDKICSVLKMFHKFDKIKAFI